MRSTKQSRFALESLESRICLSAAVAGVDPASIGILNDVRRYRVDAIASATPSNTGSDGPIQNILNPAAQDFFNRFYDLFHGQSPTTPSIASFALSVSSATIGTSINLTASSVTQTNGSISAVAFYRSTSYNPTHLSASDTFLGYATASYGAKFALATSTTGLTAGTYTYYAIAIGSSGLKSAPAAATLTLTALTPVATGPVIGSFTVSPTSVTSGNSVQFVISNITDNTRTVNSVAIYRESNSTSGLQSNDTFVGYAVHGTTNWTLTFSTTGLFPNSYTFYAVASDGAKASTPATASLIITPAPPAPHPVIGSFTVSPTSVVSGNNASFVISNLSDAGSTISNIAIFRESNSTTGFQTSDTFVGNATHSSTSWTFTLSTANLSAGNYTFYALATDAAQVLSTPASATLTITAAPTPAPAPSNPVSIAARTLTSFSQLLITGTSGNDSIVVSQSGNTITVVSNGTTQTFTGNYAQIEIISNGGNDTLTVNASVTLSTLIYGSTGNDIISDLSTGLNTIVTLGGGTNTITGNGVNTMYWVNTRDILHASSAETVAGLVHVVSAFYQPYTTSSTAAGYVPLTLTGQNLQDPTASATASSTTRLNANSLWGTGPTMADVNQGQAADCYYLATIQSLAFASPARLENMAVDLGDGTYAVQFHNSNGAAVYVRVDGDLPTTSGGSIWYARPGASGDLWAPIMEKAYAYFRTAANTYASLDWGWTGSAMDDLGVSNNMISLTGSASSLYQTLSAALANHKAIAVVTNTSITGGAPLVGSHAYSLIGASYINGVYSFTVRNPWGIDGAGSDSNPSDGIVTLTLAQLQSNIQWGSVAV